MINIGIIGASGQVGTETCLYLSQMQGVNVIPICRTSFSAAFLKRCGLNPRIGSVSNPEEAKLLLADCDLVADFIIYSGLLPSVVKQSAHKIVTNVIKHSKTTAQHVYMSSIMAFGMGKNDSEFKNYFFARSIYGKMKRYSEQIALQSGKECNKKVYILRLGQVHGELQNVSRRLLGEIRNVPTLVPDSFSYTIFPLSIAEALVNIAKGKESPGTYTLVSNPEWSWKAVHQYYCDRLSLKPEIIMATSEKPSLFQMLRRKTQEKISTILTTYAEPIASYILIYFPGLERRIRARYYTKKAKSQILEYKGSMLYKPYSKQFGGRLFGKKLKSLTDSRITIEQRSLSVKKIIDSVGGSL